MKGKKLSGSIFEFLSHPVANIPGLVIGFIIGIVPWNFIDSVSRGQTMSVVFACIFIGLGTGFVKSKSADYLLVVIDAVSDVFNLLFLRHCSWRSYMVPIWA